MVRFKERILRNQNRWLRVEFIPCASQGADADTRATYASSAELTGKHVWSALRESVLRNFGDTGWGAVGASLNVKYFSPTTNLCIIRVARDHRRIAWAALTLIKKLQGSQSYLT